MRLCWWMAAEGGSDLRVQHSGAEAHVLWSRLTNSGAGCVCCAQSAQSCLTLWDPVDWGPPGSSVHGISQARVLDWVCHFLLQGIFPTQGSNLCLLRLLLGTWILYH